MKTVELFKHIDLFDALEKNELEEIVKISTIKTLQKDNILFYEGDTSNHFYFLLEGELKLYKTGIKSQEVVLHRFIKPTMIAEMVTLENMNFPATSIATQNGTKVALIERKKFITILNNKPKLSFHIIKSLTKKIKNLELSINRNLIFDATAKVCSLLKENPQALSMHKKTEVANMLNMAPETLSRTLAKLKKLEIINQNNEVLNVQKLDTFLEF